MNINLCPASEFRYTCGKACPINPISLRVDCWYQRRTDMQQYNIETQQRLKYEQADHILTYGE